MCLPSCFLGYWWFYLSDTGTIPPCELNSSGYPTFLSKEAILNLFIKITKSKSERHFFLFFYFFAEQVLKAMWKGMSFLLHQLSMNLIIEAEASHWVVLSSGPCFGSPKLLSWVLAPSGPFTLYKLNLSNLLRSLLKIHHKQELMMTKQWA